MIIDKGEIVLTGTDDRQIIYDSMIHYMYSEAEMGRSNHFAADVHAEIAERASKIAGEMQKKWKDITH